MYFQLPWVFVVLHGLSLVTASRGYTPVGVRWLLIVVAPLIVAHGI